MRNAALLPALILLAALPARAQDVQVSPVPASRMPSRGGSIVLKINDYEPARQQVLAAARRAGAELVDSHSEVNFQGKRHGWLRFRLTAAEVPGFLTGVRGVGKLFAENITSADHLSEYEDLERRVERLREHQERLEGLLKNGRRLRGSDILYIQERLFRAGVDEGMLLQRRLELERAARASNITVELFEPEPRRAMDLGNWYAGAALRAKTDLFRFLAKAATAGAYALFFAPFWVPALVIALFLLRWLLRRGRALLTTLAGYCRSSGEWIAARWPIAAPRRSTPAPPAV
jgi:hypothetical protein